MAIALGTLYECERCGGLAPGQRAAAARKTRTRGSLSRAMASEPLLAGASRAVSTADLHADQRVDPRLADELELAAALRGDQRAEKQRLRRDLDPDRFRLQPQAQPKQREPMPARAGELAGADPFRPARRPAGDERLEFERHPAAFGDDFQSLERRRRVGTARPDALREYGVAAVRQMRDERDRPRGRGGDDGRSRRSLGRREDDRLEPESGLQRALGRTAAQRDDHVGGALGANDQAIARPPQHAVAASRHVDDVDPVVRRNEPRNRRNAGALKTHVSKDMQPAGHRQRRASIVSRIRFSQVAPRIAIMSWLIVH